MMEKIINKITKNWLVKLICIIAAVLIWFYNNYVQLPEKYFSIPLKIINISDTMAIAESYQNTAAVKVKGEEKILQGITIKNFTAEVDLKNAVIGKNNFPVKVEFIKNVKQSRIVSIDPQEISIKMDRLSIKEVPVSITVINSPLEGYVKTGEVFTPKSVVVSGPYSVVNELDVVRTKPIDIGGVTGSIYKEVELDLPAEFLTVQNNKKINININIQKNYKLQYYKKVRIFIRNLRNNLKIANIDDLYADVRVEGPSERLAELDRQEDFLFLDMSDIDKKNIWTKRIKYNIPWNCILRKIEPEEIKVKIEVK